MTSLSNEYIFEKTDNDLSLTTENIFTEDEISNFTASANSTYYFHGDPVVIPMALIMVIIIILAVGGNVMVILTILRHRGMRTRTNMFIVNLAVADILVAVLDMPVSLTTLLEGDWVFGEALCKLNGFTMALFLICSIHTLMYIAVHKYISITRPFSRAMTPRRIKIMILASWLWAAFCATGPLIGWNKIVYKEGASQCGPRIPKGMVALSHSLLITTSNYVIPLGVMIFCYLNIFREIHVHMKRIRETSNIDLENSVTQQKKVATTLFLVLACFLLCWTPYVLYSNAVALIEDKRKISPLINPLAYWCGYLNSACNPIIYAFRSPSFRKGYKEIMCGAPSPGLSAANSMSFRSRSARGSAKSTTNTVKGQDANVQKALVHRQRTMLSQTSWRSLPIMPTLIRTFSKQGETSEEQDQDFECTMCGLCTSRSKSRSYKTSKCEDEAPQQPESLNKLDANLDLESDVITERNSEVDEVIRETEGTRDEEDSV